MGRNGQSLNCTRKKSKEKDMNPINESGQRLEREMSLFLSKNNIPYDSGGSTCIDFKIRTDKGIVYLDCTNQNVGGSVMEKLPHKIWKYWKKFQFKEVVITRGREKPNKVLNEHIQWLENVLNIKVYVLSFNESKEFILDKPIKENSFF
jgi:hypothetical protein